ncbi:hypothetical protein [Adhaeribacter radiodurans]|uniref:Lipocalin family protein n=1 Tax=Adhaeribacter radiodurans TaxID=2745197 RepID=A0A7L7LF30_9BACT|nr:hypothetical protein [Adhaeribacter radiodurans]QMU31393.1 hypothetical protein HUW48_26675 [Adhaeribacter radiodurans]
MKSNFLLSMFILLLSCQKTETTKSTKELVKGVWKATAMRTEYYNAANVKVYEEPVHQTESTITITDKYITFANPGSKGTYKLEENKGKKYIYASPPDGEPPQPYEINTLTESGMTWLMDLPKYTYSEKGVKKLAAKCCIRIDFQRQ